MAAILSKIPGLKPVSEAVRERETFRYAPSLSTESRFNSDGRLFPSTELATANDSILTALAQLGTYQTKTARAFISLFDSSHQYIIAEAAPSTPIAPGLPSESCPVPLSLCGTAIPRDQGTCDHVLYLTSNPGAHDAADLPLSFVPNLAADPRFSSRPYCQFGDSGQFYAAVPIRTRRGISIGAFCVMNQSPPKGWGDQCTRSLRDISHAVMDYLDYKRSQNAYRRNERMNRGLGSFIEGKSTLTGWQSGTNLAAFVDDDKLEGGLNMTQQHLEHEKQDNNGEDELTSRAGELMVQINDTRGSGTGSTTKRPDVRPESGFFSSAPEVDVHLAPDPIPGGEKLDSTSTIDDENVPTRIFSRAANVIREAVEIEGCLFFDITLGSYGSPPNQTHLPEPNADKIPYQLSSTSSSDEQGRARSSKIADNLCDLLGFSTTNSSSINTGESIGGEVGTMPKRFLAKLLRRYPNGKIFNFDAEGELQSSDSSEDDGMLESESVSNDTSSPGLTWRKKQDKGYGRLQEGSLIRQTFPSARCVAFIPVWDPKRERWLAGGFAYSHKATRVFSVEGELSFLKAFGMLIAIESMNLETLRADKAKSDALGSLSHELRSPLHGAILGTELLNDTDLNVFQENATHTIETCCRTMLDIIDHLLDFSKVNSLTVKHKRDINLRKQPGPRSKKGLDQFGKKQMFSNTMLDGLVEEVVESVFAGFNFQHMSVKQLAKRNKERFSDVSAQRRLDLAQSMEQLGPNVGGYDIRRLQLSNVSVYLSIDPACNWMFHVQPGAIRRIVMNLFGNALKYTTSGMIRVSLTQETLNPLQSDMERVIKIVVQDTGKGMSEDYLRHRLFKPFSQEDELVSGVGLGLSLVKKIVSQLQGKISVESQVDIGTTIAVTLQMHQSPQASELAFKTSGDNNVFEKQKQELKGLRVRIFGFQYEGASDRRAILEDICSRWLQLDIVLKDETVPDIVLWSEDALPEAFEQLVQLAKYPNIVICSNALVAYQRHFAYENIGQSGVFEFTSQPIGPRKLAKSILLAYRRWMGLSKFPSPSRPKAPNRAHSSNVAPTTNNILPSIATSTHLVVSETPPTTVHDEEGLPAISRDCVTTNKVLLVDDNQINLKILCAFMKKLGREYEAVTNGKEAVDAFSNQPNSFAYILMDISMPVMDGLEATRKIRAYEQRSRLSAITIIALTGLSSESTHREALESGVDVFLTKPARLKSLRDVLRSIEK